MKVTFRDLQEPQSKATERVLSTPAEVARLFRSFVGRPPFIFELIGENGFSLIIGYSSTVGAVEHARSDGRPPYMMAMNDEAAEVEAVFEFVAGGTPTPIPARFCLPIRHVMDIAGEFILTGERLPSFVWEEI